MRTPEPLAREGPLPHSRTLALSHFVAFSPPVAADLRLTGTLASQYFRFGCDRQLRWHMVPAALRGGDVPAPNDDPALGPLVGVRPGMGLLTQAGRRFERRAMRALVAQVRRAAGRAAGTRRSRATRRGCRTPPSCRRCASRATPQWLVQPELRVTGRGGVRGALRVRRRTCGWRPRSRTSSASGATGAGG